MTTRTKKLYNEAMKLPYRERAVLAEQLWNSADEKEWLDELHRRADEMRTGKVKGIPIEKALALLGKRGHGASRKR